MCNKELHTTYDWRHSVSRITGAARTRSSKITNLICHAYRRNCIVLFVSGCNFCRLKAKNTEKKVTVRDHRRFISKALFLLFPLLDIETTSDQTTRSLDCILDNNHHSLYGEDKDSRPPLGAAPCIYFYARWQPSPPRVTSAFFFLSLCANMAIVSSTMYEPFVINAACALVSLVDWLCDYLLKLSLLDRARHVQSIRTTAKQCSIDLTFALLDTYDSGHLHDHSSPTIEPRCADSVINRASLFFCILCHSHYIHRHLSPLTFPSSRKVSWTSYGENIPSLGNGNIL